MATEFPEPLVHSSVSSSGGNYWYRTGMGMVPSADWVVFMEDFIQAEQATEIWPGFTALIDAGATMIDGIDLGGVIDITSDAADEGILLYQNRGVKLSGKRFFLEARVKVTDADDTQIVIGLSNLGTLVNPEDVYTTDTDFIAYGTHVDGDATPALIYDKNNGGPVTDTPAGTTFDITDNTWHRIAIWYNGATTAATNGALVAFTDGAEATRAGTIAQIPEDVELAPFIVALLEDDSADTLSIDYFRFAFER